MIVYDSNCNIIGWSSSKKYQQWAKGSRKMLFWYPIMVFKCVCYIQKHEYLVTVGPKDNAFKLVAVYDNIIWRDK